MALREGFVLCVYIHTYLPCKLGVCVCVPLRGGVFTGSQSSNSYGTCLHALSRALCGGATGISELRILVVRAKPHAV